MNELVQYGSREEVASLAKRIKVMCPGGDKLQENEALALAQVATVTQLNPFIGEVWYIPGKGPMVGIKGARRLDLEAVQKKGGYTSMELYACDATEAGASEAQLAANDIAASFRCEITDSASSKDYQHNLMEVIRELRAGGEPDPVKAAKDICGNRPITFGWGFSTLSETSKMNKTALARKRAEADALKKRIDIPFGAEIAGADNQSEIIDVVARDPENEQPFDSSVSGPVIDIPVDKDGKEVDDLFPPMTDEEKAAIKAKEIAQSKLL